MRGHVRKRGNSWCVIVDLGRDHETGRRRRKWHSGYRTRKDAERARVELLGDLDRGTYVESSRQTVAEYLQEWLPAIAMTIRPTTLASYRRNLEHHVIAHVGDLRLAGLDAARLNALYAQLLSEGHRGHRAGEGLSPRTVRYVHTILRRALKDAVRWSKLARNPADAADPPKASSSSAAEMKVWSAYELRVFLDAVSSNRLYSAWLMLATTGMRRGEALGLRWEDVDLETGRASIRQTLTTIGNEVVFSTPKTAKGRRSIALDRATVTTLRSLRVSQAQERLLLGASFQDHGLVFATRDGRPIHPARFSREFDRAIKRHQLPRIRLHDLRHTWASLALAGGIHPKVVSERLGHAGIGITLDTYSHVIPAMQADAAETVASIVFGR